MQDYGVFVLASSAHAAPIVSALRARGLRAWADRPERITLARRPMPWADALVIIDTTARLRIATDPLFRERAIPKVLFTSTPLDEDDRVWLLDRHEFDRVLPWPGPAEVVA